MSSPEDVLTIADTKRPDLYWTLRFAFRATSTTTLISLCLTMSSPLESSISTTGYRFVMWVEHAEMINKC
jgi:hypothetical protein